MTKYLQLSDDADPQLVDAPAGEGTPGPQGPPGAPMDTWQGPPTAPGTQDGQSLLDVLTGDVYGYGTEWNLMGNIKGPKGDKGDKGDPGTGGTGGGGSLAGYRNWDDFGSDDNSRVEAIND